MHARTCTHTHPCTPSYTLVHSCTPSYHKRWKKIFLSRIHIYPQGSSSSILASFERVKQTFSPRLLLVTRLRDKGGLGQGGATICGSSSSCSGGGVCFGPAQKISTPQTPLGKRLYIFFSNLNIPNSKPQHPTTFNIQPPHLSKTKEVSKSQPPKNFILRLSFPTKENESQYHSAEEHNPYSTHQSSPLVFSALRNLALSLIFIQAKLTQQNISTKLQTKNRTQLFSSMLTILLILTNQASPWTTSHVHATDQNIPNRYPLCGHRCKQYDFPP